MMAKTHVPIGVATAIGASAVLNEKITVAYIIAAAIGSMFQDGDHPRAKINQKLLFVNNKLGKLITYCIFAYIAAYTYMKNPNMTALIYLIPIFLILAFSKHRGITHSILGASIMIFCIFMLEKNLNIGSITVPFAIGYVMHIVADLFTHDGIEILWPNEKNFRFPITICTNGFIENLLSIGTTALCFYLYLIKL